MPIGAAHVLGDLTILFRDEQAEQRALQKLCAWAYQFSPIVSSVDCDGLLIEVGGSLRLFSGLDVLQRGIRRGLRDLGYKAYLAIAPTPWAATVLGRSQRQIAVRFQEEIMTAVSALSMEVLRPGGKELGQLESLGVHSIGDCLRLPRGGLSRRLSPRLVQILDQMRGRSPDPRPRFQPPKRFRSQLELPWEVDNALALSTAGQRLLHELVGYLRSMNACIREVRWSLTHNDDTVTHFYTNLTESSREYEHLVLLLREHLSRLQVTVPIRGMTVYVDQIIHETAQHTGDLFERRGAAKNEDCSSLIDRLRARLGHDSVKSLDTVTDHRPERAWRWREPDQSMRPGRRPAANMEAARRPLWLTSQPLRIQRRADRLEMNGPLHFDSERERIESGWWDKHEIARDYFIAKNPAGGRFWVYRELSGDKAWYLHGIFE
jgi:protein ImuB